MASTNIGMLSLKPNPQPFEKVKRAILYDILLPGSKRVEVEDKLAETENLLKTYGGIALLQVIQRRHHAGSTSFVGRSKFEDILTLAKELQANLLIINVSLKPSQLYKLKRQLEGKSIRLEIWDRVDLILNIFKKHARTAEAKLQLELTHLEHYGPRIYGMGEDLSRQAGGIGSRGLGETNTEIMKRHLANRKRLILRRIDKLRANRSLGRERRQKRGLKSVSLVGYTNAGKSSLFRALTKRSISVDSSLFSTLDTTISRLFLPTQQREVVVSDTIGFVQQLPPNLIKAFMSTLEETVYADLLVHVVDASRSDFLHKINSVHNILIQLGCETKAILYAFNKVDLRPEPSVAKAIEDYLAKHEGLFVSAKSGQNIDKLITAIEKQL